MDSLLSLPNVAIVPDISFRVRVRGEKIRKKRKLLVISTYRLDEEEREKLLKNYLSAMKSNISFPLKERSKHLVVRFGDKLYNFGWILFNFFPIFRTKKVSIPREKKLEVVLNLSEKEKKSLESYLENIKLNRAKTIGGFKMRGHQYTVGTLENNKALVGGHNCTSWIGTAPIGKDGKALLEDLGGSRDLEVATNPGWWTSWLAAAAPEDRIPFVIYWSPEPLEKVLSGISESFEWDFRRR